MNINEKTQVKENLEREKIKMKKRIADLKELTKPVAPDCAIGRVSRMDAINNKSVNEAALRKAEEKLQNIDYALAHIHEPEFGVCRKCGAPIPHGRLIVMPGSSLCVRCASR